MRLSFVLILFSINVSFSQTWKYSSGGNTFDGKYKVSSITGYGTDFPYDSPKLFINKFDDGIVNFYISGAGYFPSVTSTKWAFDNEPGIFYESLYTSTNEDSKIIFFNRFRNPVTNLELDRFEIIEKLTMANFVEIRITTSFSKNDLKFSLSGSSRAIDYVLGIKNVKFLANEERLKRKAAYERIQNLKKLEISNKLILDEKIKIFRNHLDKQSVQRWQKSSIINIIKNELTKNNYEYLNDYDTIKFIPIITPSNNFNGRIEVFLVNKNSQIKIKEYDRNYWNINDDSPIYSIANQKINDNKINFIKEDSIKKIEQKKRAKAQKDRILVLLSKLSDKNLIEYFAINVLLKQRERLSLCSTKSGNSINCSNFPLENIKDLKITFDGESKSKIINSSILKIIFNDESSLRINNLNPTEKNIFIDRKFLEKIGQKLYVEF